MTETERRLLWLEARDALHLGGDYADWPDRLALPVIARLHDPVASGGMLAFLEAEADAGRLPTETIEWQTQQAARRVAHSQYVGRNDGRRLVPHEAAAPGAVLHRARNASAADVVGVVQDMDIGRFLAAWIAPYRVPTEAHQEKAAPLDRTETVLAKRDILDRLHNRYRELENAWKRGTPWITAARVKHGRYILERIEDGCRDAWPKEAVPASAADLRPAAMLRAVR